MERCILGGRCVLTRDRTVVISVIVILASWVVSADRAMAQAQQPQGTPCHVSPDKFALEFFHRLEGAPLSYEMYAAMFASEFKNNTKYEDLEKFVSATHKRFGIDRFDKPLETRLEKPPSIEQLPSKRGGLELSVGFSAFTARGRSQQRVEILCEKDLWKVMAFSYEPVKD